MLTFTIFACLPSSLVFTSPHPALRCFCLHAAHTITIHVTRTLRQNLPFLGGTTTKKQPVCRCCYEQGMLVKVFQLKQEPRSPSCHLSSSCSCSCFSVTSVHTWIGFQLSMKQKIPINLVSLSFKQIHIWKSSGQCWLLWTAFLGPKTC